MNYFKTSIQYFTLLEHFLRSVKAGIDIQKCPNSANYGCILSACLGLFYRELLHQCGMGVAMLRCFWSAGCFDRFSVGFKPEEFTEKSSWVITLSVNHLTVWLFGHNGQVLCKDSGSIIANTCWPYDTSQTTETPHWTSNNFDSVPFNSDLIF